jgi:hypothetical protein
MTTKDLSITGPYASGDDVELSAEAAAQMRADRAAEDTPIAKHTPGPWIIDPALELPLAVIADTEDGLGICELGTRTLETEANARLIAAAPDLLAALQTFATWHAENFEDFSPEVNASLLCVANEAEAAIAKATA